MLVEINHCNIYCLCKKKISYSSWTLFSLQDNMDNTESPLSFLHLLLQYGADSHHKSRLPEDVQSENPDHGEPECETSGMKCMTLVERICHSENIPDAQRLEMILTLYQAGYNLSVDNFLDNKSCKYTKWLRKSECYKDIVDKKRMPNSLLSQCRRAIVRYIGDPCWNKVTELHTHGLPNLMVDYLHFTDLQVTTSNS